METERAQADELEVMVRETTDVAITDEVKMALARDLLPVAERMRGYTAFAAIVNVANQEDADRASGVVAEIDRDLKLVKSNDVLTKITDGLFKLHRRATAFRALFTDPMERDKKAIRAPVLAWEAEEARKAAAIAAKLQAEADAKAAIKRAKEEAEARRQLDIQQEAERKALEARRKAEKAKGDERARLEAEANAADRKASAAAVKVESRIEAAAKVIAPTIHIDLPKSGLRTQTVWKVKRIDESIFFNALAGSPSLYGYVEIKTTNMERAKAANPSMMVPGVEWEQIVR